MSASAQEKTERASPKRLREARERGEVPRSRELAAAVIVGGSVIAITGLAGTFAAGAADWMRFALQFDADVLREPGLMTDRFGLLLRQAFWMMVPLFVAGLVAALLGPLLIGGWNLSAQALKPDFGRVSPLKGLGRMFSSQAGMELFKALIKAFLLGAIAVAYIHSESDALMALGRESLQPALAHAMSLALNCLLWMCGGLVAIALVDAPWQLWSYFKRLRMSRQEVKEEHKQAEGSPEVKGRIRQMQQQIANRRMMEKLPTADVVIVNPTHYAVALKYEAGKMRAPRVVAKGLDLMALAIREKAKEHRIPIVSAPPLARALYRGAELEQEIPATLYAAVAQVLTYVYQLRAHIAGTLPPKIPDIGDVPGGEADPVAE
jgi:flagellar biosynthetic protein FlhB